ncbi:MAG: exodeoxyribonuclease VII large subunit [Deltaproteobacteria bacterium]|nr:exodeoxyribonuclease VII large subunit [Deltaproteobacteria bacterium]
MSLINQNESVLTVTQLTKSIKTLLEGEFRFVRISGEISNLKTPFSGHSYFSLKDSQSQVRAVLFKNQKRYLSHTLADGQQVICFGRISVYEPRGDYQLIIDTVEQYGTGNLQIEFEKLKQKLSQQGLFSDKYKKEIPPYPQKIVVISSPTGAALRDFLKIAATRESSLHIQILPVRVQGRQAAPEIAGAIHRANSIDDVDIIVLCRGGGSIEDLWAFNDEQVARAIFDSQISLVTGIGHEVDFTIADFCADIRCPTPTAAATQIIPDSAVLKEHLNGLKKRLAFQLHHKINSFERLLHNNIRLLSDLDRMFENLELRLNLSKTYLFQAAANSLTKRENQLNHQLQKLQYNAPLTKLEFHQQKLRLLTDHLVNRMQTRLNNRESDLSSLAALLNGVSPLATLARGYSIVTQLSTGNKGKVVSRSVDIAKDEKLGILLHEGFLECTVTKVKP